MHFNGDARRFALAGELTIKGITRPIGGAVIDADGSEPIALALRGRLDCSDYGLVWNPMLEAGNVVVGDAVDPLLDVAAVRLA